MKSAHTARAAALVLATATLGAAAPAYASDQGSADPGIRLVLQITVDGLRGDLLERYRSRFGEGGFTRLLERGTVFRNAHYMHANTETIVGHATLATGAHPAQHGMVGNVWFDRETGELIYNIEDPAHHLLATRPDAARGAQVDPTQQAARTDGRSPSTILASTFSDELNLATSGQAKIFAVSGKDRGAVSMAGHAGKAFWFSTDSGDFVTSSFYYREYPDWVQQWNAAGRAASHAGKDWTLSAEPETYLHRERDDRPFEADLRGYGRVFPHPFGAADDPLLFTRVLVSPVADQLTANFAKALIRAERLGRDGVPDYLGVSFSGVDAVNHFFGPASLENEDVVRSLDATLADLLAVIDHEVGLQHTLIVLSADHGMAEFPEYMAENGMQVGRLYSEQIAEVGNAAAEKAFGIEGAVKLFFRPYVYLDDDAIEQAGVDHAAVERVVATAIEGLDGIALAAPKSAGVLAGTSAEHRRVLRNTHPTRSGDIYVAQLPYWFLFEKGAIRVMHGSPWRYDTFVPIIFAGPGIRPAHIDRPVRPVDVAPTLAAILGIKPPSSSQGEPLHEVLHRGAGPGR